MLGVIMCRCVRVLLRFVLVCVCLDCCGVCVVTRRAVCCIVFLIGCLIRSPRPTRGECVLGAFSLIQGSCVLFGVVGVVGVDGHVSTCLLHVVHLMSSPST